VQSFGACRALPNDQGAPGAIAWPNAKTRSRFWHRPGSTRDAPNATTRFAIGPVRLAFGVPLCGQPATNSTKDRVAHSLIFAMGDLFVPVDWASFLPSCRPLGVGFDFGLRLLDVCAGDWRARRVVDPSAGPGRAAPLRPDLPCCSRISASGTRHLVALRGAAPSCRSCGGTCQRSTQRATVR
jgi:hypothetical protein